MIVYDGLWWYDSFYPSHVHGFWWAWFSTEKDWLFIVEEEHLYWLVVWNIFYFFHILRIIIPTKIIFFRGVGIPPGLKPPTRITFYKIYKYPMIFIAPNLHQYAHRNYDLSGGFLSKSLDRKIVFWNRWLGDHRNPSRNPEIPLMVTWGIIRLETSIYPLVNIIG